MRTIGFKNFRRFEELEPIELSDITFFVGGNNAGKSTVVKAMMLMMDNVVRTQAYSKESSPLFRLGSDSGKDVHVGTFGRALHKPYPDVREIEFESVVGSLKYRYVISGDVESQRLNADIRVQEISDANQNWSIKVDYSEGVIRFSCPQSVVDGISNKSIRFGRGATLGKSSDVDLQAMINRLDEDLVRLREGLKTVDEIRKAIIERDIKQKEAQKKALQEQWKPSAEKDFTDAIIAEELHFAKEDISKEPRLFIMISNLFTNKQVEAQNLLDKTDSSNTRAKCEAQIRLYEKIKDWLAYSRQEIRASLFRTRLVYIPSHAVAQRVFFSREDKNDYMSDVIGKYQAKNYSDGSEQKQFVQAWMKNFGIGLGFKIDTIQGEAFTVTVTNMHGEEVPLADLGMGSIQIVLLLLKLATLIDEDGHNSLLVVEEPEQNIHPKLQSKLAELFENVHREYGFRFLIETHSEYMIRKTQAMIATESVKFEENPFRVYYFPERDNPYDMVYQESGMFEGKFGDGFFDEASRQLFEVMKKARTNR